MKTSLHSTIRTLTSLVGAALLAGPGLLFNSSSSQAADTWLTVDQPNFDGYVYGLAYDRSSSSPHQGTLYAVGDNDLAFATVRKSTDAGVTWGAADSFSEPGSWAYYICAAVDPDGAVYAAGSSGSGAWFVRKSTDGGTNWNTVNEYTHPGLGSGVNFPYGMAVDADGILYMAGTTTVKVGRRGATQNWLVRRSSDHGGTWSNVDDIGGAWALDVALSGGAIYVVGSGDDGGKIWRVRKGVPNAGGGIDWQTIDSYRLTTGLWAEATGISADAAGNLFVVGYAESSEVIPGTGTGKNSKPQQVKRRNWVVRTLPAGGSVWQTIDVYRALSDYRYEARDVGVAADGTVWVNGYALGPSGSASIWITRKRPSGGTWSDSQELSNSSGGSLVTDAAGTVFVGGSSEPWRWTVRGLFGSE